MIRATIIIPCYNAENYIRQCVESAINQTEKNIEIIAINDGSKDRTVEILLEYQRNDKRITVID